MKKQKIQFIVILIVLAVLIAATFGMKWYNKNKEEEKTAEEEASTIYISKVLSLIHILNPPDKAVSPCPDT